MRFSRPEPRIWMRMAAIALCFSVPLVLTTYFYVGEKEIAIDFANQELRGDEYLRPVSSLLVHVELHRLSVLRGDGDGADRVAALVDEEFTKLAAVDERLRNA